MRASKPLSVALSILTALLVVSASIAVPLLCRPFYYAHIGSLGLTKYGLAEPEIRRAYDEMMDFCLGLRPDFAAGELWWSESGASHFADVRKLFLLDLWVLGFSLAALAVVFVYCRTRRVKPHCFAGHGPGFWAAAGLGAAFLTIGGLAALDFDRAFVIFHSIFFPGKTNWLFYWEEDPIILFLPQEFFRNCAVLILALLLVWCAALILSDLWAGQKKRKPDCPPSCEGCPGCKR